MDGQGVVGIDELAEVEDIKHKEGEIKYKKNQRVIAKSPIGTEVGTIVRVDIRYVVKLDKGLAFLIAESDINPTK